MTTLHVLSSSTTYPVALWMDVPPPAEIGSESLYPFTLYLSADNLGPHTIYLYAQDSGSSPWQLPRNKWSHLIPQWRFTDTSSDRNTIFTITPTESSIVTNISGDTIGMVASAQFYYIDDTAVNGCDPILIWATLEVSGNAAGIDSKSCDKLVPGYANSKVIVCAPYYINGTPPVRLGVTRDGVNPMFDIYWKDTHIPHVVTVRGNPIAENWCPEIAPTNDPILFNIPETNAIGVSGGPVYRNIVGMLTSDQTWAPDNQSSFLSFCKRFKKVFIK